MVNPLTAALWALGSAGKPGRDIAARVTLIRAIGARHAWHRIHTRTQCPLAKDARPAYVRIWGDAARTLGADLRRLPGGFLELASGRRTVRVWNHWVPLDDIVTTRLALDKPLVHRLLMKAGLPVPTHREVDRRDIAGALTFVMAMPEPCVVKPASLSGGSGTTAGIMSEEELRTALLRAGRIADRVLIERQVRGDVYRLLFLDGELLDVIRRRPPRVTGDGRSTIEQLIQEENRQRSARWHELDTPPLFPDLDCALALERAGLTLSSVLSDGVSVDVGSVTSQNGPNDNETVRDTLAPELVVDARRAAELVGLRLAGVDVVAADPTRSLRAGQGVVLEVNGTPGLHYHYAVADPGSATPVAVPVLRALLA
jgi:D-alanine-D-alanine ligase-like ATP-grasp enzyme